MPPVSRIAASCLSVRLRECGLKRVGVGMRGDQRRVAQLGDVPEAALVEMRQVDQDFQPVAGADQLLAEIGQAGPDVGRRRTAERHAVPEHVRPAPHRAERAQPGLMQHVERLELRVDRLGAFDMQHRGQRAGVDAMADVVDGAADADPSVRLALDAEQDRRHARSRRPARSARSSGGGTARPAPVPDTGGALSAGRHAGSSATARRSRTCRRRSRPAPPSADRAGPCLRRRGMRAARPRLRA